MADAVEIGVEVQRGDVPLIGFRGAQYGSTHDPDPHTSIPVEVKTRGSAGPTALIDAVTHRVSPIGSTPAASEHDRGGDR
jgi:hypothetical protein